MIEKTATDGFMARHILHWPMPEYPDYNTYRRRIKMVDDEEKKAFVNQVCTLWKSLGEQREQTQVTK